MPAYITVNPAAGADQRVCSLLELMSPQSFTLMAALTLFFLGILISYDLWLLCHEHYSPSLLINLDRVSIVVMTDWDISDKCMG